MLPALPVVGIGGQSQSPGPLVGVSFKRLTVFIIARTSAVP
ncbi:Uncharacterised protein [Mycobacteroides abscessus subsp. abscessus]|nr:Uncharacterised protein [Mycobacteroides abscessus subsp. abscessus]